MSAVRRIYLPPERWSGDAATCDGEQARRIASVLRLRAGDALRVFDGRGRERAARLDAVTTRRVTLTLLDAVPPLAEPGVAVTLACVFPRGGRGDWIVEKATELGVARIVPVASGRAVLDPGEGRLARWRRVAIEAAEQCGRAVVPEIGGAPPAGEGVLHLVAEPRAARPLRAVVASVRPADPPAAVVLHVGPEGGWSDEERAAFAREGATEVSLGPRTLRVETAAVVGVAEIVTAWESPTA